MPGTRGLSESSAGFPVCFPDGVDLKPFFYRNRPGARVRLGIVGCDFHLERSIVRAAQSFGHFRDAGQRCAVHVDPQIVPEARRLDHQRVAGEVGLPVGEPPRRGGYIRGPIVSDSAARSNTTSAPHEYFYQTALRCCFSMSCCAESSLCSTVRRHSLLEQA